MMGGARWGLGIEMIFTLGSAFVLKEWIFPFIIWQWFFPSDLAATLLEWTVIMTGVICCFIYLGLGSSSRYAYGLRYSESFFVLLVVHLPLGLGLLPLFKDQPIPILEFLAAGWQSLTMEWLKLLTSSPLLDSPVIAWLFCTLLFALGRLVQVKETNVTESPRKKRKISSRYE